MSRRYPASLSLLIAFTIAGLPPLIGAEAGPTAEGKLVADGPALLRQWLPPIYPPAELKARQSGMVNVSFIVDDTGRVSAARALEESDAAFIDSALAAVRSWSFTPALEDGRPVACGLETLVPFSPAVGQQKKSKDNIPPAEQSLTVPRRVSPSATVTPSGNYPDVLVERKFAGIVRFACVVTTDGKVIQPRILAASHVDFVLPALESLKAWEFSPAMQGDLTVQAPVDGKITFDALVTRIDEMLLANGVMAPDGSAPAIAPEPIVIVDPVLPIDALLKGEGGSATVDFTVSESGSVRDIRVREATHPDFGDALAAALETWGFARPVDNNQVISVQLTKRAEFAAVPLEGEAGTDPQSRLVHALRRGLITGAKGLDEKLAPLYQVRPEYPLALKANGGPAGRAELEFVIDREGRVRLPRVLSATHPEFGWSAATAVSQWVFHVPRKAGEAVDIKVKMPIMFAAIQN